MLGVARQRQRTNPPARADALADIVLRDHDDAEVRLGDLWRERPAALVWMRHYGWVHCRHHAVQLHRAREEFDDAGVTLVLIGQGTPRQAARFREQWELDLPVVVDAERESYRAAGAKVATMGELLGPRAVSRGAAKTLGSAGRIRQGRVIGHPAQLGGALLIDPQGAVRWSHMSEDASDNAPPDEILDAARAATAGS